MSQRIRPNTPPYILWTFRLLASAAMIASPQPAFCSASSTTTGDVSLSDKEWSRVLKEGVEALDSNRYWIAEPQLKQAVIEAGKFGFDDVRLAKSLGELGRLYVVRGRFSDAEPHLEEELEVKQRALGKSAAPSITNMGALIRFYLLHGTATKAGAMTEELLDLVEGKLREAVPGAKKKVTLKQGVPLEGFAASAVTTMRDPLIEWSITCDALGSVYRMQSNFEMSERLHKTALDIKSTVLGKEHLSLANSYDSLGELSLARNDLTNAEYYFEDALAQTERILPSTDGQVYARLDKLAKCLIKAGKHQQAEKLYLRAQTFWKEEPAKNGEDARAAYALGSLYTEQKRFEEAAPILQHALELAEQNSGPCSVGLVPYLQRYAYTLYYLGRKPEQEQLKARADSITGVVEQTPASVDSHSRDSSRERQTAGTPSIRI